MKNAPDTGRTKNTLLREGGKLPNVGTTIFTVMSSLAIEHKAINLGQGFPDFGMSEELIALVNEAMKSGHNQYAHMKGYGPLLEAIAEKAAFLYQTSIHPDTQITITPGGTYALHTAMTTVLQPGDEVIVFEPAYDSYIPGIQLNGALPIIIPLTFPDYKIGWNEVRRSITDKTRMIILNSPHNPTGAILSADDIRELTSIVSDSNIIILSDEVYEHIIFDGFRHESILRYPDLLQRSFVCFSFGKNYHCTGWKLGYCIAPAEMMKEFRKVHQFNCFSCDTPKQVALAAYLEKKEAYLQLGAFMQQKRDYLQQLMRQTKFEPLPSYGSFFQCYSYRHISNETENEFVQRLVKEFGIVTIPVSAFYQTPVNNQVIRLCFVKKESTLEEAVERLRKV